MIRAFWSINSKVAIDQASDIGKSSELTGRGLDLSKEGWKSMQKSSSKGIACTQLTGLRRNLISIHSREAQDVRNMVFTMP
jgi:hypothetical protein